MSTITSLHEHAVEVDTRLEEAYRQAFICGLNIQHAEDNIRHYAGQKHDWRTKEWSGTFEEALNCTEFKNEYSAHKHAEAVADRAGHIVVRDKHRATISECNADWRAHGCWSRFYLVTNANGHIHSSVNCSTCYDSTQYAWLTHLSALTEEEAVKAEGEVLCTICFPSAPVAWTNGMSRRDKEAKAKREAEKAERLAEKARKSLSLDGSVVSISVKAGEEVERSHGRWKEFKTLRSAELWLVEALAYQNSDKVEEDRRWWFYAPDGYSENNFALVLELLAQKKDISVDEALAPLTAKALKKLGV